MLKCYCHQIFGFHFIFPNENLHVPILKSAIRTKFGSTEVILSTVEIAKYDTSDAKFAGRFIGRCDVISMTHMANTEKMATSSTGSSRRHGGKYCVAGRSKQISCNNSQFTEGISMHEFPNEEKYPKIRRGWVSFVRKHRPNFAPSRKSYLCSAHFERSAFTLNMDVAASLGMKRNLKYNAVPTIDVAGISEPSTSEENISDQKRRQVFPYYRIDII